LIRKRNDICKIEHKESFGNIKLKGVESNDLCHQCAHTIFMFIRDNLAIK